MPVPAPEPPPPAETTEPANTAEPRREFAELTEVEQYAVVHPDRAAIIRPRAARRQASFQGIVYGGGPILDALHLRCDISKAATTSHQCRS